MITRIPILIICLAFLLPVAGFSNNNFVTKLDTLNLPDTLYAQTSNCTGNYGLCLGDEVDPFNLTIEVDGELYFGQPQFCSVDTIYRYTLSTLFGSGNFGPYYLNSWYVNGVQYSGQFQNANALVALMNQYDPNGNWTFDPNTLLIAGGVSGTIYSEMEVLVFLLGGAKGYIGLNTGIDYYGTRVDVPLGEHKVVVTDNLTGEQDSVVVNYVCVKTEDIYIDIDLGQTDQYCLDLSDLTAGVDTIKNLCELSNGITSFFSLLPGNCVEFTGIGVGVDSFCAVVCDVNGICDTTTIHVNVSFDPSPTTVLVNIYATKDTVYCFDTGNLPGTPVSMVNICPGSGGVNASFNADNTTFCVDITGISAGVDSACFQICDDLGGCDTFTMIVVVKPLPQKDTIYLDVQIGNPINYCFDLNELGNVASFIKNYCQSSSGTNAKVKVDFGTGCLDITGLSIGQDTACFEICNKPVGICDTFIVIVNVLNGIPPKSVDITVEVGEINTYCIDTTGFPGTIVGIINNCPSGFSTYADIAVDAGTYCVYALGITPGLDSACIIICTSTGFCDTTIIKYHVVSSKPPQIVDLTVEVGETITYCIDMSTICSPVNSVENICPNVINDNAIITLDQQNACVDITGLVADGVDSLCVAICCDILNCDTVYIYVHVVSNSHHKVIDITIEEGETINYCLNPTEYCSPIVSVENLCPTNIYDNTQISFDDKTLCAEIEGTAGGGVDTLCILINCGNDADSITLIIHVLPIVGNHQVINVNVYEGDTISYCLNKANLCSPIVSVENLCPGNIYDNSAITFNDSTLCADIEGLVGGGSDTLCLKINCGNISDTVILIVNVKKQVSVNQVININVLEGGSLNYCLNQDSLCTPIINVINLCPGNVFDNSSLNFNNSTLCADINGLVGGGSDTLCLLIDCGNIKDTVTLIINVIKTTGTHEVVNIDVENGETTQYCLDINELCSPIISIVNICPGAIYDNSVITFNDSSLCADIVGVQAGGTDTLCLQVNCGNVLDTIILVVNVIPAKGSNQVINVTIIKGDTINYCFEDAGICTPVNLLENLCPNTIYDNTTVEFDELSFCAIIKGIKIGGSDTLCYAFCCGVNNCDTITLIVNVVPKPNPPTIINFTIDVTDTLVYCLDTMDLEGPVASITNLCPGLSGSFTTSTLDTASLCFTFVGAVAGGQDIFCIVTCDSTGTCDTTVIFIKVIQKIINPSKVVLTVFEDSTIIHCLDISEIGSTIISNVNICPDLINDNASYTYNTATNCISITGITAFGTDTACIVICGSNGYCDTFTIIINVVKPVKPDTLYFTVEESTSMIYCFNPDIIGGTIVSVVNICPQQSGDNVAYFYSNKDTCITIVGLASGGPDTACFVICNATGFCDTIILITNVYKDDEKFINDVILVNFKDTICFDVTGFDLNTIQIVNECPGSSGEFVTFNIIDSTLCLAYMGIDIGKDTACITITDSLGNILKTTIVITVIPPKPNVVIDQIEVDTFKTFCFDVSELAGNIVNINNLCPELSGSNVSYVINQQTICVTISGLTPGVDTLCMQFCDDLGACDTTYFYITVPQNVVLPIANDDIASTEPGKPINIIVLTNDLNPNGAGTVAVVPISLGGVGPKHGTTLILQDGTIVYTPDNDFCGVDSFTYILCIPEGCDEAIVTVTIECPNELTIFNAISPNNDDKNEFFKIVGLQNYPDNKLSIFNRWGNRVYFKEGYENDWSGTWEGKPLPDGTYFYFLEDGKGKTYNGYLTIYR